MGNSNNKEVLAFFKDFCVHYLSPPCCPPAKYCYWTGGKPLPLVQRPGKDHIISGGSLETVWGPRICGFAYILLFCFSRTVNCELEDMALIGCRIQPQNLRPNPRRSWYSAAAKKSLKPYKTASGFFKATYWLLGRRGTTKILASGKFRAFFKRQHGNFGFWG